MEQLQPPSDEDNMKCNQYCEKYPKVPETNVIISCSFNIETTKMKSKFNHSFSSIVLAVIKLPVLVLPIQSWTKRKLDYCCRLVHLQNCNFAHQPTCFNYQDHSERHSAYHYVICEGWPNNECWHHLMLERSRVARTRVVLPYKYNKKTYRGVQNDERILTMDFEAAGHSHWIAPRR